MSPRPPRARPHRLSRQQVNSADAPLATRLRSRTPSRAAGDAATQEVRHHEPPSPRQSVGPAAGSPATGPAAAAVTAAFGPDARTVAAGGADRAAGAGHPGWWWWQQQEDP